MRVMQTLASSEGFRDLAANDRRTTLFRELLLKALDQSARAIVLPGGYWFAADESEAEQLAMARGIEAADADVLLIAGVDISETPASRVKGEASPPKGGRFPYFGFACRLGSGFHWWRQTSTNSRNAAEVPDADVPGENRVVTVEGDRIGVLICGELFNQRARVAMAAAKLALTVDLGHVGMGTGVTRSMEGIAKYGGCAVMHSQHVAPHGNASLHFVDARGVRESVKADDCDYVQAGELWIAYRVREVG